MGCGESKEGKAGGPRRRGVGPSPDVTAMYEDDAAEAAPFGHPAGPSASSPRLRGGHRRRGSASSVASSRASSAASSRVKFDGGAPPPMVPLGGASSRSSLAGDGGDLLTPRRVIAANAAAGAGSPKLGGGRSKGRPAPIAQPSTPGSSSNATSSLPSVATPMTPQHIVIMRNEVLGRGGYGVVYKAYNKTSKTALAVKECQFDEANVALVNTLRKEYETLAALDHPHIVKVFHFTVEAKKVARIYMELMPSGSVRALMASLGGRFSETSARRILHQALLGLQHLHERGILHRDLKPDNMLIDARGIVKLSDFGTSKATIHSASGTTTMVVGTVVYMAPETISGRYSRGSDVWALAATFLELVSGDLPWSELGIEQTVALLFHIGNARPPHHHPRISSYVQSASGRRLLKRCFAHDPKARPTVAELLAHPYFAFSDFAGSDEAHRGNGTAATAAAAPAAAAPANDAVIPAAPAAGGARGNHHHHRHPHQHAPAHRDPYGTVADVGGGDAGHVDDFDEIGSDSLGDSFASISDGA